MHGDVMARFEAAKDRPVALGLDLWGPAPPPLDAAVAAWLTEPGLLTARLRTIGGERLRLSVVRQALADPAAELRTLLDAGEAPCFSREIELCIAGVPWVFAQTLVPDATLRACPWLAELGDSPLGETLGALKDVTRAPFEYAELSPNHPLCARAQRELAPAERVALPARRAVVSVRGHRLLVQEVFLGVLVAHALG